MAELRRRLIQGYVAIALEQSRVAHFDALMTYDFSAALSHPAEDAGRLPQGALSQREQG